MPDKGIAGYSVNEWEKMEQRITTLRAQLKKHGGHTADCQEYQKGYSDYALYICIETCGWAEIEKGLDAKPKPTTP